MNEENKRYNPRDGTIHPEPTSAETNAVPDNNQIHRKRLIQEIEEKRRLINLTKAMSGAPASEGGINREKANKTVQLLKKDISNLVKELTELESEPNNLENNNNQETLILEYLPLVKETNDQVLEGMKKEHQEEVNKEQELSETDCLPPIEEKHKGNKVDTQQIYDTYEPTSRIGMESINKHADSSHPKFFSINNPIAIALLLLIIGIVVTGLPYFNLHRQTQTPPSPDNNIAEKVANPAPALTNTSNTTGLVTQSKNEVGSFITNIEKEIVGWWDESKPKAEFSSATRDIKTKPVTDADKIIGKWVMYDPGAAQNGYENSYTFNRDNTGEKITILDGKSLFKYQISGNNIVLLDIKPCKGFDIVPQDAYTNPCEKKVKRYEFRDDDTLILDNTVFERK